MEEWGLRPGDRVELRGLSRLELNGQRGTLLPLEFPEQAKILGRLAVMLDSSGRTLSVKVENIVPLSAANGTPCDLVEAAAVGALQPAGQLQLPPVGLGTCFLPEDLKEKVSDQDFRRVVDDLTEGAVLSALRAGVRLFESGNRSMNQQAVGRALSRAISEGLVSRSDLHIVGRIARCRDRGEVRREVDMLLRELMVDYVDVLLLDVPPERAPGAWAWAEEVHGEGRARHLAVADFDLLGPKVCVEVFRDFLASVAVPPAAYAMEVHPFNTNDEMADCCRGLGLRVLAYSPLGAPHKMEAFMQVLTPSDAREMRRVLKVPESRVLQDVARRHGVTAAQVALRWNVQRGHTVLPKSFNPAHIAENLDIFGFTLSQREMAILAGLHKGVRAERFLQQACCQGHKALPRMTRDAQDACEAILSKVRGPGSGGLGPAAAEEERMQAELAELYRQQEVVKGKGRGMSGAPDGSGGSVPQGVRPVR